MKSGLAVWQNRYGSDTLLSLGHFQEPKPTVLATLDPNFGPFKKINYLLNFIAKISWNAEY
jgi:hypothetical protein